MVLSWAKARELQWWDGFKENNFIRSSAEDSWPFTRFEWANEMLYSQITKYDILHQIDIKTQDILKNANIDLQSIDFSKLTKENIGKIYARLLAIDMLQEINFKDDNGMIILIEEIKQILILTFRNKFSLS